MTKCIDDIFAKDIPGINNKEKKTLLKDLTERLNELKRTRSDEDAHAELFKQLMNETDRNEKMATAQRLHAVMAFERDRKFIFETAKDTKDKSRPLLARLNGIIDRTKKWARGFSINNKVKSAQSDVKGRYLQEMEDAGVRKFYDNKAWKKANTGHVFEEISKPGTTGKVEAAKIAEITSKFYDETRVMGHEAGLPFEDRDEFMASFHRDPTRMRLPKGSLLANAVHRATHPFNYARDYEMAYQRWKRTELPLMKQEKTFRWTDMSDESIDKVMRKMYDHQVLDNPFQSIDQKNDRCFKGLASRAAKRLRIFYNDGYAFDKANNAYGSGDMSVLIEKTLDSSVHNAVFAKEFTTQPYTHFAKLRKAISDYNETLPSELKEKYNKHLINVGRVFDELSGLAKIPESTQSAKITNDITIGMALAHYGSSIARAFSDLGGMSVVMRHSGEGYIASFVKPLLHVAKRAARIETLKKDVNELGYFMRDWTSQTMSRFLSADSFTGVQSKLMHGFFNANLIHPWDSGLVGMSTRTLARQMFLESGKSFEKLHPDFQWTLQRYNLEKPWDLIRKYNLHAPDGRKFITPDDTLHYTKKDIADYLGKKDISDKLYRDTVLDVRRNMIGMLEDRAHFVYLKPDITQQAIMRMGTRPGTIAGNINRLAIQGRAWPIAIGHRILGNMLASTMEGEGFGGKISGFKRDLPGIASYISMLAVTNYATVSLMNAIQGKAPPNPLTAKGLFYEATGIYGMVLESLFRKHGYGNDAILSVFGPGISTTFSLFSILNKVFTGQKYGNQLYHLIRGNLAGANLFYIKFVLDYLIGYHIQEMISPGSVHRMARNSERRGEHYIFDPRSAVGV